MHTHDIARDGKSGREPSATGAAPPHPSGPIDPSPVETDLASGGVAGVTAFDLCSVLLVSACRETRTWNTC